MPAGFTPSIAIIGGGPAGLMAAEVLAGGGCAVTVYDRMPSLGRKFLMAGRGGLNLTHSEGLSSFLARYGSACAHLDGAIGAFPPSALRDWSEGLGEPTFIGSSGRVFPKSFKASPLLRAWLRRLDGAGVTFRLRHHWLGWDRGGGLAFHGPDGTLTVKSDGAVLALGGASWPKLGSDGGWVEVLTGQGVAVVPLRPANCGFTVGWSELFRSRFAGQPLKRIALSFEGETVRGEALITETGLEGGGIYALSARLRGSVERDGEAKLYIALRPDRTTEELTERLALPRAKQSLSNFLRKVVALSPAEIGLLHEATLGAQPLAAMTPDALAALINKVPVRLIGVAPIARAISTAGGISFDAIDEHYMLRQMPGVFVAGEMLDWEAPTGGYLLQASFATGAAAGRGVLAWLSEKASNR